MKHLRLVLAAAVCTSILSAALALACDKTKTTATTASRETGTCTAEMAKQCTSEMAAACKASNGVKSGVSTTSAVTAPVGKVNAMAVESSPQACSAHSASAVTASTSGCPHSAAVTAAAAGCPHSAAVAAGASCSDKKTVSISAGSSCSAHKSSATAAGNGSCSPNKGANTALSTVCNGHGLVMGSGGKVAAHDCDACADLSLCEEQIQANGATVQVVPIKNGVMYVYTADSPAHVQGVQAAMAHRNEHVSAILASGDHALLCPECKSMRGAIASGKLNRETVNVEGGCMTLVTSKDPAMVAKLHAMAGFKGASKIAKI